MNNASLNIEEAKAFLAANPTVQWIDAFVLDMNGHPRGKRLRRDDLMGVAKSGMMLPASVFIMDPRGNCIAETGRLWSTGDPDYNFRILSGTLKAVPVDGTRFAQAVIVPEKDDPLDPRYVLRKQVERFKAAGHTPVAAVELEYYVTMPGPDGQFTLEAPPGVSRETDIPLTFQFEDLDALQAFNDDIYRIAEAQGLPVDALTQESGPSQFEINLKHTADVVQGALDGLLLKRAIKAAARARGLNATFMAKPHHEWAGSGMHIHMSLLDKGGANVFAGEPISPVFRNVLGGLRETMGDFMAIWAQSANAYRRYVPESYVSMAPHWGFNNRTVALRIPDQMGPGTRVEHRVAGADANPYLVIASILAGAAHGMAKKVDPGPEVKGNSEELDAPGLPTVWANALEKFEHSPIVRDAFGADFQHVYTRLKSAERTNFERVVTSLDHLWYAQVA
ncbi:glutamine synthetase family protein [Hyphomicrobium sp.]|uniref:glutamine synthetase family protein n=1 Tax=Hyphomicrobium sp. TaxID=82 RepID=UPI002E37D3EB|nr:glutamine synthetase family protein [Hyphomicrobium sp.]HEX2842811.1 glutamine synthetase family protein [Hyphomicrobium sp.]